MANVSQITREGYKDVNTGFGVNGAPIQLTGNDAVVNDLINLVSTPIGSVAFAPTYGSNIGDMLFDNITNKTYKAFSMLADAINEWVPAVVLFESECEMIETSPDSAYIRIVFAIRGASTQTLGLTFTQ